MINCLARYNHMTKLSTGLSSRLKSPRFNNLQALRAVAALGVVIYHARDIAFFEGHADVLTRLEVGQAGVDLFFVLSGFLMVFITESRYRSPTSFMMERGPAHCSTLLADNIGSCCDRLIFSRPSTRHAPGYVTAIKVAPIYCLRESSRAGPPDCVCWMDPEL